jgi:hypothetical protein
VCRAFRCVEMVLLRLSLWLPLVCTLGGLGLWKLTEPGGGLFLHAAFLLRAATTPRCSPALPPVGATDSVEEAGGPPVPLSVCLTYGGDPSRDLLEWLAFHRLQGVQRFDIFWDVKRAYNASAHEVFLDRLGSPRYDTAASSRAERTADVHTWTKESMGRLLASITAASRSAGGLGSCGPSRADIAELEALHLTCQLPSAVNSWECQRMVHALCLAAAKLRGDEWLGLFDVDEFMFAPGRVGREEECFWGGAARKGVATHRGSASACVVPVEEAPWATKHDLVTALQRHSPFVSSVVVEGVAFAPQPGRRDGLVTATHTHTPPVDASGLLVPPRPYTLAGCPGWLCGGAQPKKSFVRVQLAALSGLRTHHHDTGPFQQYRPTVGAPIRLHHYPFDDMETIATTRPHSGIAENREGVVKWLNAVEDRGALALLPLVQHCLAQPGRRECAGTALSLERPASLRQASSQRVEP